MQALPTTFWLHLPEPPRPPAQQATRKPGEWIRRRTRRLQQFFGVTRREALCAAVADWRSFMPHLNRPTFQILQGGKSQ